MTERQMSLDEAVSVAQRMKNTFRAFEFLEEFLSTARAAQAQISNAKQEVEQLEKERDGLEVTNKRLKDEQRDISAKINELRASMSTVEGETLAKKEEYQKQLDADRTEASKKASQDKARIQEELEKAREKAQAELTKINKAIEAKKAEAAKIQDNIDNMKHLAKTAAGLT